MKDKDPPDNVIDITEELRERAGNPLNITFTFAGDARRTLDEMMRTRGFHMRSEVIREAIIFYESILRRRRDGHWLRLLFYVVKYIYRLRVA